MIELHNKKIVSSTSDAMGWNEGVTVESDKKYMHLARVKQGTAFSMKYQISGVNNDTPTEYSSMMVAVTSDGSGFYGNLHVWWALDTLSNAHDLWLELPTDNFIRRWSKELIFANPSMHGDFNAVIQTYYDVHSLNDTDFVNTIPSSAVKVTSNPTADGQSGGGGGSGGGTVIIAGGTGPFGYGMYSEGRNLLDVLGIRATTPTTTTASASEITAVINALHTLCNFGTYPDFSALQIGDYLDGISLTGLVDTTLERLWDETTKNNRVVIADLNPYKNINGNTANHILFSFEECMYCTTNLGYYGPSGTSPATTYEYDTSNLHTVVMPNFKQELLNALGVDRFYNLTRTIKEYNSNTQQIYNIVDSVFLPSGMEICGVFPEQQPGTSVVGYDKNYPGRIFSLFDSSLLHRVKKDSGFTDSDPRFWTIVSKLYNTSHSIIDPDGNFRRYIASGTNPPATPNVGISPMFSIG